MADLPIATINLQVKDKMIKKLILASSIALCTLSATAAIAADSVGFQFRVPFAITTDSNIKNSSANSLLISFFLDQDTEAGILTENYALKDDSGAGSLIGGFDVNALRISKNLATGGPVYVGMDLGKMNVRNAAGTSVGAISMADIFGGVRLLSTKGKVTSFLGVELAYRMANADFGTTVSKINNFGGVGLNLSAGVNF